MCRLFCRWCFDVGTGILNESCRTALMTVGKSENTRMMEPSIPSTKRARKGRSRLPKSSNENMNDDLWKEFPEDLWEAVIARLPIPAFFRFRLVCKEWNMLLTSQSFTQEYAKKKQQPQSWFYTVTHEKSNMGSMYDPTSKRWYHPKPAAMVSAPRRLPVASAGGLICFLDYGDKSFYICNPLTRSCKKLPPISISDQYRVAVGMTLDGHSPQSGYRILCVSCEGEYEIFDSTKGSWCRPRSMSSAIDLPIAHNFRSQAICVNRTVYFMRTYPDGVVSCNIETGVWEQLAIPAPRHLSCQTLAECNGKIMLVGLLRKNAATCICIWELQKMTMLWKEVDRMPNFWCLEFYGKHVRMTCLGNKGLLMLSLRSRQMNRLLTYDMTSREWTKVTLGRKVKYIACGTAFQPCLTALP